MSSISIILLAIVLVGILLGCVIGLVKGFTNVRSWAMVYLFTVVLSIFTLSRMHDAMAGFNSVWISFIVMLAVVLGYLFFFAVSFRHTRRFFKKAVEKAKERSYYKNLNAEQEREAEAADALEQRDMKRYRKLVKHKAKQKAGWAGIFNHILGAIALAAKGFVVTGAACALVAVVLNTYAPAPLQSAVGAMFESSAWLFCKKYVFDCLFILLIMIAISCGYRGGIVHILFTLFMLALVIGAGFGAFTLSGSEAFKGVVEGVSANFNIMNNAMLSGLVGRGIVIVLLFLIALVPIILIGVFVPRLLEGASQSKVFSVIDGLFGALILTVIMIGLTLFLGALYFIVAGIDTAYIQSLTSFFTQGEIVPFFHGNNPLNTLPFIQNLPIRGWFFGA